MKIDIKRRIISVPTGLVVREIQQNGDGAQEESRTIEGKAIVFDTPTVLYDGPDFVEREIIQASCVTPEFLAEQDVVLNLLHERDTAFARSNKGVGTLKMEIREDGLYFSVEAPKCSLGEQALELVRNKTYTGCSMEFYPKDYEIRESVTEDGRPEYLIVHKAFDRLTALTIAMEPAYEDTEVVASTREARKTEDDTAELKRLQKEVEMRELRAHMDAADAAILKREFFNNY